MRHSRKTNMVLLSAAITLAIGAGYIALHTMKGMCFYAGDEEATQETRQLVRDACYEKYWYVF